jgi:hypothetical protein
MAATVVLSALPATASAANRKATGKTSQGRQALVWVRGDGSVSYVRVRFKADCRKPDYVWTDGMFFRDRAPEPFQRDGAMFSNGGKFKKPYPGGSAAFNTMMTGGPSADGGFEGTFRVSVRLYSRKHRLRDVCRAQAVTWKVGPPA